MKVLFLNEGNGFEAANPRADLVELPDEITPLILKALEKTIPGVYHSGGNWKKIVIEFKIEHTVISTGRKSDYTKKDYDEVYTLISGNY